MNHPKLTWKTLTTLLITVMATSLLTGGLISYVYAQSSTDFTLSQGIYPGAPDFTLWREDSTYYSKSAYGLVTSGTNASQIVQNAVGSGNVKIFLSSGTFQFSTFVELYNNTKIHGSGIGITTIQYIGSLYDSSRVFHDVGGSGGPGEYGLEIKDLSIDCNDLANFGIQFENAVGIVERVEVYGFVNYAPSQSYGVGIIWGWGETLWGTATPKDAQQSGIYIKDNLIRSATATAATGDRGVVGIFITNTWYAEISGNIIRDLIKDGTTVNRGIQLDVTIGYVHVTGNRIQNVQGDSGIHFVSGGAFMKSIEENIISKNTIIGSLDGINVGVNTGVSGARTHRNQIQDNIIIDSEAYGIICASSNFSSLQGNYIINPARVAQGADWQESGIILSDSQYNLVTGNFIIDNGSSPLMEYGIMEFGLTTDNNSIKNNFIFGVKTAAYGTAGGATPSGSEIFGNFGYPSDLDMLQQSILNATFDMGTAFPSSPVEGQYFWRSDLDALYVYNSTSQWQAMATGAQGPAGTVYGLPFSYLIFQNSTSNYLLNGTTGVIDFDSTNASRVHEMANGNLSSGGKIVYGEGTYNFTVVTHLKENITYSGVNRATVVWQVFTTVTNYRGGVENENWADTSGNVWDSNVIVEHLTIDGRNESQSNSAPSIVCLRNAEDFTFYDVHITNGKRDGLRGANSESPDLYTRRIHIIDSFFSEIRSAAIQPVGNGIHGQSAEDWITIGTRVTTSDVGIGYWGTVGGLIQGNNLYSVTLDDAINSRDHIAITLETNTTGVIVDANIIDGNWATSTSGGTSGIAIMSDSHRNRVTNNILTRLNMTNSPHSWIGVSGGSYANVITGNQILAIGGYNAIALGIRISDANSDNNEVTNNYFFNCSEGVRITNADGTKIELNTYESCTTSVLDISGTNTIIKWNEGYVTESGGSQVNGTATTWTIAHGLAATPVFVSLSFNATGWTSYKWSADATDITVTITGTPESAVVLCYWDARTWN